MPERRLAPSTGIGSVAWAVNMATQLNESRGSGMKTAVVTGVTGQDGAYLAQLLLEKGYRVFGTYRRTSSVNFWRIEELGIHQHPNLQLVEHDLLDIGSSIRLFETSGATEVYNLAAQSFVGVSFDQPLNTSQITGIGALNLLEAIRSVNTGIRFYQASTSEMFGKVQQVPQTEDTKFYPRSPYGVAKLYAHWITVNYREAYGLFACNGILFNHESPLRGETFVTRKITRALARIHLGLQDCLYLGNLGARRDWGHARDYVEMQWRMLQQETPEDYVIATGVQHSVRDFVTRAAGELGVEIDWQGRGQEQRGVVSKAPSDSAMKPGQCITAIDARYFRPAEVETLLGDPRKAREKLGWVPTTTFEELVAEMMQSDLSLARRDALVTGAGYRTIQNHE